MKRLMADNEVEYFTKYLEDQLGRILFSNKSDVNLYFYNKKLLLHIVFIIELVALLTQEGTKDARNKILERVHKYILKQEVELKCEA